MIQFITWPQYFLILTIATIAYYILIWIVYFRSSLSLVRSVIGKKYLRVSGEDERDEIMATADHIIRQLRPLFGSVRERGELLMMLQEQLATYSFRDDPELRKTINHFIISESERQCSIRLVEDDLGAVWL
jgi:hypothetical protein